MKSNRFILASVFFICVLCASTTPVRADIDNKGTDFILSFTPNIYAGNDELHLTSDVPTTATVNYPVIAPVFTTTVAVNPGAVTIVELPTSSSQGWTAHTPQDNAVEITAPEEVVTYMINRAAATSDAALGLPVDTMNTEYIVSTYNEAFVAAEFIITAAYDGTTVNFTPTNALTNGTLAGTPVSISLNRGQGYLVQSSSFGNTGGLAGTIVTADKPIGVTNGNGCTQVPIGTTACDTLMEVAQPISTWANQALAINLPERPNGTVYRILASQDNTSVSQDGSTIGTINKGQFLEIGPLPDNHVLSGDKPIFVTQYITGNDAPGAGSGDPAMGNVIPTAQFLNAYTFSTVGGQQFAFHYLMLVVNNADVGTLLLDGAPVGAGSYTAIPGTAYSTATLGLSEGTHTTSSTNPHGIYVLGYNSYDSYLYPGGGRFKAINPIGDPYPPICAVHYDGIAFSGTGTDNRPSEDVNNNGVLDQGEDLNNNNQIDKDKGVYFVELLPGSSNVNFLANAFVPGAAQVGFSAKAVDSNQPLIGTVRVTDGAGNSCDAPLSTLASCDGVPGGGKVVDRCGVCGGDGTSCLGCVSTDLTATLVAMDGGSLAQKQLVQRGARLLGKNKKYKKLAKSISDQAEALYLAQWTGVWSFGVDASQCSNSEFCVSSSTAAPVNSFVDGSNQFNALLKQLNAPLHKSGTQQFKINTLLNKGHSLHKSNVQQSQGIPTTVSQCSSVNQSD